MQGRPVEILSSRSMARGTKAPKRSPTPTSTSFPPDVQQQPVPPPPVSVSATQPVAKPLYLCSPFVDAALVKGNFKTIVMLPKYVDIMEWVAMNGASSMLVVIQNANLFQSSTSTPTLTSSMG